MTLFSRSLVALIMTIAGTLGLVSATQVAAQAYCQGSVQGCRTVAHVGDDGFDGPFKVKCKSPYQTSYHEIVWINEGSNSENGPYAPCPHAYEGVVAIASYGAGYIVRCTVDGNGVWQDYGNPDGSWQNLGQPSYAQMLWCVSQVA